MEHIKLLQVKKKYIYILSVALECVAVAFFVGL